MIENGLDYSRIERLRLNGDFGRMGNARFSADGKMLLTTSEGGLIYFWDVQFGELHHQLKGYSAKPRATEFSPDGKVALIIPTNDEAFLWNVQLGELSCTLEGARKGALCKGKISPNGRIVLIYSVHSNEISFWNAQSGKMLYEFLAHGDGLTEAEFSPDSRMLLTCSLNSGACLWDISSRSRIHPLLHHRSAISLGKFSPDSTMMITCDYFNEMCLWDVSSGKPLRQLLYGEIDSSGSGVQAEFRSDGKVVFVFL